MHQNNQFDYAVVPGEVITLDAVLTSMAEAQVSVLLGGAALSNIDGSNPKFQFTALLEGLSLVTIGVWFNGATATPARCEIIVSGSQGGRFVGPTFTPQSPLRTVQLSFDTRTGPPRLLP